MKQLSDENKARIFLLVFLVVVFSGFLGLDRITREKDPAYQPQPTTFGGRPAFGQLHRDGLNYTFYKAVLIGPDSEGNPRYVVGEIIRTFPVEEAEKLH
jgi:hypothetical protein